VVTLPRYTCRRWSVRASGDRSNGPHLEIRELVEYGCCSGKTTAKWRILDDQRDEVREPGEGSQVTKMLGVRQIHVAQAKV
jgi:hypothetical protein